MNAQDNWTMEYTANSQAYWTRERLLKRAGRNKEWQPSVRRKWDKSRRNKEWEPLVRREWDEWEDKANAQENWTKGDKANAMPKFSGQGKAKAS